jgi:hypothetical protein
MLCRSHQASLGRGLQLQGARGVSLRTVASLTDKYRPFLTYIRVYQLTERDILLELDYYLNGRHS